MKVSIFCKMSNDSPFPYPLIKDPYEEAWELYGEFDDFKAFYKKGYDYGVTHHRLISGIEEEVYGKPRDQFNFYEQKGYDLACYQLEYYFEVVCRSF